MTENMICVDKYIKMWNAKKCPVVKHLTDYEFEIEVVLDPHNENIVKEVRLFGRCQEMVKLGRKRMFA